MVATTFRPRNNRKTTFVTQRAMHKDVCRPFFLRRGNETYQTIKSHRRWRNDSHRNMVWHYLRYSNSSKVGMAMKTTLTPFTISELATPSGNKVPVRGKTMEVTRLDVETFKEGNVARLLFWLKDGTSEAVILTGQIVRGSPTSSAAKREDV